ncbi:MAG: cell division protein ZapA [Thiomicrorhabdus chilensis]|uniref:cell division protein ZapA n=1 Tax=Thiomicrorhabdus chilensis TaxID=63656 RepID=UPI000417FC3C|nr:cell division protein ZapA [Thiomicrorhabdus chilensis]MDX1347037.1 cell division protein ZapA [Thiomicrorhabdus chilensis]
MLTLTLMNHTFEIPCEPEEKEGLIEAATLIEDRLEQLPSLKGESKVLMVALNLAYEHLQMKDQTVQYTLHLEEQIDNTIQQLASDASSDR